MSKKSPNVSVKRTLIFAISALTAMTTLASCKENTESYEKITEEITVIKDCTGTYARIDNNDYLVCNKEILDAHDNLGQVTVTYHSTQTCPSVSSASCTQEHKSSGNITIMKIK